MIYKALNQVKHHSFTLYEADFQYDIEAFTNPTDKHLYCLIKDICNMIVEISYNDIKFSPCPPIIPGQIFFKLSDMTDDDFELLKSLNFKMLPTNICARIADLLWTEKQIYGYATIATDAYIDLFKELSSNNNWQESLNMVYRALAISKKINHKEKRKEICALIYNFIIENDSSEQSWLLLSLIKIVIKEKYGNVDTIIDILNKIIQNYEPDIQKTETAYTLKSKCCKLKGDEQGEKDCMIGLAKYYEKLADKETLDNFRSIKIAEKYLMQAVFIYRKYNEQEQAKKVQKQIVFIQSKLPQMMGTIKSCFDVTKLRNYIETSFSNLSFQESIVLLTEFTFFLTKENIKQTLLDEIKQNPLSFLFPENNISSTGQTIFNLPPLDINNPESDQELFTKHLHKHFFQQEKINGDLYLKPALSIIRKKYDFKPDDLNFFISNNPIIPEGRENIFKNAIYMALKGYEYEAIHILSAQIENLFRNLAKEIGAITVTLENDGTSKEKLLSTIFYSPELTDAYDNDILFIFKGLLNEKTGANIRNLSAHGLLTEEFAKSGVCCYFICATIRLLLLSSPIFFDILTTSTNLNLLDLPTGDIKPVKMS